MISSCSRVSNSNPSEKSHADRPSDADRLTGLPTEIQTEIIKYLIPNKGCIAIGYDCYGHNTSGIRAGSLSILRVSKHLSKIALQVLYGYRWFRISTSYRYYSPNIEATFLSAVSMSKIYCYIAHISLCVQAKMHLETRWNVLRQNTDQAHPLDMPLDCFNLLVVHTPAHFFFNSA